MYNNEVIHLHLKLEHFKIWLIQPYLIIIINKVI